MGGSSLGTASAIIAMQNSFQKPITPQQHRALRQIVDRTRITAPHCREYIARLARFASIVISVRRNLSTFLP